MNRQLLQELLYTFLNWHPARIQTFACLILAVVKAKTVRVKELAMHVESQGNLHAQITKVERWFLHQAMDFVNVGKLILKLLGKEGKLMVAIDRTNWQFGKKDLNFFVAAVVYGNISIPIACILLDKRGNSSTAEREKLIDRLLQIVPKEMIEVVLADREFIGEAWLKYLHSQKIPFAVRLKKSEQISHFNGGKMKLSKRFSNMAAGESLSVRAKLYGGLDTNITCLQLEKEQLFVASNVLIGQEALLAYKQRWSIERSFKALKTSGFNLEDTHITSLAKLEKLFAIVAIALTICVIAGEIKNQFVAIVIKKHGRRLYSLFTYGFDWLRAYSCNTHNSSLASLFQLLRSRLISACQQ